MSELREHLHFIVNLIQEVLSDIRVKNDLNSHICASEHSFVDCAEAPLNILNLLYLKKSYRRFITPWTERLLCLHWRKCCSTYLSSRVSTSAEKFSFVASRFSASAPITPLTRFGWQMCQKAKDSIIWGFAKGTARILLRRANRTPLLALPIILAVADFRTARGYRKELIKGCLIRSKAEGFLNSVKCSGVGLCCWTKGWEPSGLTSLRF